MDRVRIPVRVVVSRVTMMVRVSMVGGRQGEANGQESCSDDSKSAMARVSV